MQIIGLTGGMAMGKSTAAGFFRRAFLPVFDADRAVHRLEGRGGRAVAPIGAAFPGVVRAGRVDRARLRAVVGRDPVALARLEAILHPLVRAEQARFLARARRAGKRAAVLDVPLLFETGGDRRVDRVVVVSAPEAAQRRRLAARGRMSGAEIATLLARQTADAERRRRADVVVRTGLSRHHTARQMRRLVLELLA